MKPLPWHEAQFAALMQRRARLPHALLLQGPRGVGKYVFAAALAQALLCEQAGAARVACGACSACAWFEAGTHPDYRLVELELKQGRDGEAGERKTQIEVDQIRALSDFVYTSSHRSGPRVVVIHPADAMNPSAANAVLKSLEEPPAALHFLLVTHRPHRLLPTVRSRCQQVMLRQPDAASAQAWLEGEGVADHVLALAHTGGAPLEARAHADTGYWGARAAFLRAVNLDGEDLLAAADAAGGVPMADVIAWLQKWSYDVLHQRATGRVRYNPDQASGIVAAAQRCDPLAMQRFHHAMIEAQEFAQHPLNARLFVEQALLAYRDALRPTGAA